MDGNYINAINYIHQNISYDRYDIKFVLKFKKDRFVITEVNKLEYSGKNSYKLFINGTKQKIPLSGSMYILSSNNAGLGVYDDEVMMMKDIVTWYNKRVLLLKQYRESARRMEETVALARETLKGREEYLI